MNEGKTRNIVGT